MEKIPSNKWPRVLVTVTMFLFVVLGGVDNVFALEAFVSDGCSRFPNGTVAHKNLWLACCVEHDKSYWRGGSYQERLVADQELRDCVAETGQPFVGEIMLGGVRAGGSPFFPTDYRWGYGWPYPRGYKILTETELEQIEQMLKVGVDE